MNQALQRAALLMQQSRIDMAVKELHGVLAEEPHDAQAHAMLGVCLAQQDKLAEAQAEAEQAIVLAPDWSYAHFCRSIVMEERRRYGEAERSIREAVRLDPTDADYFARLGSVLLAQGKGEEALAAALEGLSHDAESARCAHIRATALTKLNRQGEAIAAAGQTLARDPDSSMAHCNTGWALLHQSKPREALEHFREALRLKPNNDYARHGMIEALKARNPVYRVMLAYFLWMSRMSPQARWGVILGAYFGFKLVRVVARNSPELEPWLLPVMIAYGVFVLLTWFSVPLFNLLLRLNRYGRHALSRDQRVGANWFAACLAGLAAAVAGYFATGEGAWISAAVVSVGLALPLTIAYGCDPGWPRKAMLGIAGALAILGATAIAGAAVYADWEFTALMAFLVGVAATPWAANALVSVVPER